MNTQLRFSKPNLSNPILTLWNPLLRGCAINKKRTSFEIVRVKLLENIHPSIKDIEQHVIANQELSLAHWEFLAIYAHIAYSHSGSGVYQGRLYRSLQGAFNAWLQLRISTKPPYTRITSKAI